mgnify:CR=1 FL=1
MAVVKLADICQKIGSGATPRGGKEAYRAEGIALVRSQNVLDFSFSSDGLAYINDEQADKLRNVELQSGDVLLNITGDSVARACLMDDDYLPGRVNQHVAIIRVDESKAVNSYLLYYLQWRKSHLLQLASAGATRNALTKGMIEQLEIDLPSLDEQRKVVGILGSIQNKIKLNHEINDNLLEQIRTLCTAWLSDYKPFDGAVPSDWVETPLSDIAEFVSGYSYKGSELTDSTIAMATIKNFDRKGGFKLDGYKEIIPSSKLKESQHAELFDTLVAHTDLTQNAEVIGNAEPVMSKSGYDDIIFSMDLVKVLPKKENVSKFLLAAILQDKKFKAHCLGYVNGTTVLHLSKKALPEYKLFLPSDLSKLRPLDEIVTTLYKQISSNISENTYLEELRVALLPKLMSGELDVSGIDL